MDKVHVLYVDHQGHPAPLAECYHTTASRRLSSSVHRHPPSTATEVDSAFCPQCLAFQDAATAAEVGYCTKPSCRRCPLCLAVASIVVEETKPDECLYKCGFCTWTSRSCNLTVPLNQKDDGTTEKGDMDKAVQALGDALNRRKREGNEPSEEAFKSMVSAWASHFKKDARGHVTAGQQRGWQASALDKDGPEVWTVEALEQSIRSKKEKAKADASAVVGGRKLERLVLTDPVTLDPSLDEATTRWISLQPLASCGTTNSLDDLLPLPIPLQSRKSRRCRAELAEGRPGIVLKPKLDPLEGDSSLRSGHGKWWKKDSSAIHVVPIVRVIRYISLDNQHAFLLRVKNPTLGAVRLRFDRSSYSGEPSWDGQEVTALLDDLLVDSVTGQRTSAELQSESMRSLQPTDMVELDCVEDSILEMTKTKADDPEAVLQWNGRVDDRMNFSRLGLVAQHSDTAWFELIVVDEKKGGSEQVSDVAASNDKTSTAVSIALQIEVGNGSWESSLIKPISTTSVGDGSHHDFVTLDLLVVWHDRS